MKSWSSTQQLVALSSGDSGTVRPSSKVLQSDKRHYFDARGFRSDAFDGTICTDSLSGNGNLQCFYGVLGQHFLQILDVQYLWIQEEAGRGPYLKVRQSCNQRESGRPPEQRKMWGGTSC